MAALVALALGCASRSLVERVEAYAGAAAVFPVAIIEEFSPLVDGALAYRNSRGRWPDDDGELRRALMAPDRGGLSYRYLSFEDRGRGIFEAVFHAAHSPGEARVDSLEYHGVARMTVAWPADGPVLGCNLEISIFETIIQDADDIQVYKRPISITVKGYVPGAKFKTRRFVTPVGTTVYEMRAR